jgi:serine protease Do
MTRFPDGLRRGAAACCLLSATLFGTVSLGTKSLRAQESPGEEPITAEQRDRLFDDLALRAAEFEARNILKQVVRLAGPSVVHIEAEKEETGRTTFYGRSRMVEEAGSGVIVQYRNGTYVLTNRHVIKDAKLSDITVHLQDGRQLTPTTARFDEETDIAVLGVSDADLVPARVGDSSATEIGDFVVAMGSPFGLSQSVTMGIVSAKGRWNLELGDGVKYQDFLQTDAAINPGNSGGPLVNLRGEVVGINTAIASNSGGNEGVGFSIPINVVMNVARQLIDEGKVNRAFLGVNLDQDFGPAEATRLGLGTSLGARVKSVLPGSPAESAALLPGDVILRYDGVRVQDDEHLINIVKLTEIGRTVPILLIRDRKSLVLSVELTDKPKVQTTSQTTRP